MFVPGLVGGCAVVDAHAGALYNPGTMMNVTLVTIRMQDAARQPVVNALLAALRIIALGG